MLVEQIRKCTQGIILQEHLVLLVSLQVISITQDTNLTQTDLGFNLGHHYFQGAYTVLVSLHTEQVPYLYIFLRRNNENSQVCLLRSDHYVYKDFHHCVYRESLKINMTALQKASHRQDVKTQIQAIKLIKKIPEFRMQSSGICHGHEHGRTCCMLLECQSELADNAVT